MSEWVKVSESCILLFVTPWTIQSLEFSRPGYCPFLSEYYSFPSPGDLSNPGVEPRSPTLQADSLPAEPQRKPKNTGVGSLPLFQWIFLTQVSNRGVLHCRWILYQLSYQGSPVYSYKYKKRKACNAGKDWGQEEKGVTKDEMVGWHHWLNGHEFEQIPGYSKGQEGLACCSPWGRKGSDTTWQLNNNNDTYLFIFYCARSF